MLSRPIGPRVRARTIEARFGGRLGSVVAAHTLRAVAAAGILLGLSLGGASCKRQGHSSSSRRETRAPAPASVDQETGRWLVTFTPEHDSVLLAFMFREWGVPWPPQSLVAKGTEARVDEGFRGNPSLRQGKAWSDPWEVLGEGVHVEYYLEPYGADFYRDGKGIRLVALEGPHFSCDTMILSAVSKRKAGLVNTKLSELLTESGIGLGDPMNRLTEVLGAPSRRDGFGPYDILWYLGRPQQVVLPDTRFEEGAISAYALERGRVVEIYLHSWSTERIG